MAKVEENLASTTVSTRSESERGEEWREGGRGGEEKKRERRGKGGGERGRSQRKEADKRKEAALLTSLLPLLPCQTHTHVRAHIAPHRSA